MTHADDEPPDRAHWSRFADEWIAWAGTPGHDVFWAYRDALKAFIGQGPGSALEVDAVKAVFRASWDRSATMSPHRTRSRPCSTPPGQRDRRTNMFWPMEPPCPSQMRNSISSSPIMY